MKIDKLGIYFKRYIDIFDSKELIKCKHQILNWCIRQN